MAKTLTELTGKEQEMLTIFAWGVRTYGHGAVWTDILLFVFCGEQSRTKAQGRAVLRSLQSKGLLRLTGRGRGRFAEAA